MKKLLFFIILMMIQSQKIMAQIPAPSSKTIVGIIFDEDEALYEDVIVSLFKNGSILYQTKTDINGEFTLKNIVENFNTDSLILEAETFGYFPTRIRLKEESFKRNKIRLRLDMINKLFPNGYNF